MTAGAGIPVAALAAIALAVAVGGTLSGLAVAFVVDVVRRRRQRKADQRVFRELMRKAQALRIIPDGAPIAANFDGRDKTVDDYVRRP